MTDFPKISGLTQTQSAIAWSQSDRNPLSAANTIDYIGKLYSEPNPSTSIRSAPNKNTKEVSSRPDKTNL